MTHLILILIHAGGGLIALVAGAFVLAPPRDATSLRFRVFLGTLGVSMGFLLAVVVFDWPGLETGTRATYAALCGLGVYILWRGVHAHALLKERQSDWRDHYIADVGFVLISLFDAFVIIAALDLGAPVWLVVAVGILAIYVGRNLVERTKRRGHIGGRPSAAR